MAATVESEPVKRTSDVMGTSPTPKKQKKLDQRTEKMLIDKQYEPQRPQYIIENGLRKVTPYFFTFSCYAKRRWLEQKVIDVFNREFHPRAPAEFALAMKLGRFKVNHKPCTPDVVFKDNDHVENTIHRHEAIALDTPIEIVHVDDNVLVVNKPCSLPVHPCGRYRHNSLVYILKWEHGYDGLRILYRLDRLTSGLLILPRNLRTSQKMEAQLRDKLVSKEYVCRVDGEFPSEPVTVDKPIGILSHKIGLYRIADSGKECVTKFERMWTDGKQSVVKCFPVTGRTHQIRIHCQYLGHPIVNDNLYNSTVWGPNKGKDGEYGKTPEKLLEDLWKSHSAAVYLESDDYDSAMNAELVTKYEELMQQTGNGSIESLVETKSETDPFCAECKIKYVDPKVEELQMFLHCYRYKGPDWEYKTELPRWALAPPELP